MVSGEAVGLHQYLIVNVRVFEGDVAAQFVAKGCRGSGVSGVRRDGHTDDERFTCGGVGFGRICRQVAASAGVARWKLRRHLLFARGFELFGGTEAAVGSAIRDEKSARFAGECGSLGLAGM